MSNKITVNQTKQEIFENLDIATVFGNLNPTDKGKTYKIECPNCHEPDGYLFKGSRWINCHHKDKCGQSTDLFAYYQEVNNIDWKEALRILAKDANVSLPEYSAEQTEIYQAKQAQSRLYKDITNLAKYGLWRFGKNEVDYLTKRGYTTDELLSMEIGKAPLREALNTQLIENGHDETLINNFFNTNYQPEYSHTIMIPYKDTYGNYIGFVYRSIDSSIKDKYHYMSGLAKGSNLLEMDKARKGDSLIIVEGILDAKIINAKFLKSNIKGFTAVALGGSQITSEQIKVALRDGKTRNIYLCLDNDKAGNDGTIRAIEMFREHDVNVYVMDIGKEYKDPDELLTALGNEEGLKRLKTAKDNAIKAIKWECKHIKNKYDLSTDAGKDSIFSELVSLESKCKSHIESHEIISYIIEKLELPIESFSDKIEQARKKNEEDTLKKNLLKHIESAQNSLNNNNFEEAKQTLERSVKEVVLKAEDLAIQPYTMEMFLEDLANRADGLKTGYSELDKRLTIPTGAVTLIAGRPSHGKTVFMLNLLLRMIAKYPTKTFIFFSYEESRADITAKLLISLSEYKYTWKDDDGQMKAVPDNYFKIIDYLKNPLVYIEEIEKAKDTLKELTRSNRLILLSDEYSVQRLAGIIEAQHHKHDIGAIFIDYAQKIPADGKFNSIRERVLIVSDTLKETAKATGLPLIVGAQLNRNSEGSKPSLENLKEAGNLEEDANLVLGIHNYLRASKDLEAFNDDDTVSSKIKKRKQQLESHNKEPENTDLEISVMKNRNGETNWFTLLKYDGTIWNITDKQ